MPAHTPHPFFAFHVSYFVRNIRLCKYRAFRFNRARFHSVLHICNIYESILYSVLQCSSSVVLTFSLVCRTSNKVPHVCSRKYRDINFLWCWSHVQIYLETYYLKYSLSLIDIWLLIYKITIKFSLSNLLKFLK